MKLFFILAFLISSISADEHHHHRNPNYKWTKGANGKLEDSNYWNGLGQQLLREELAKQRIDAQAKNIVFFLGDGMSIPTITASRIYKGQKEGRTGEESQLEFDKFPYAALSRTYCVDVQVADSACSATAYLGGIKANDGTNGVDANVRLNDCEAQKNEAYHVKSVMVWAQEAGKGTGIVTSTRVTHATPSSSYAHSANRYWEDDVSMMEEGGDPTQCKDIARQLIEDRTGSQFKVIMGGGRTYFLPNTTADVEGGYGRRRDGRDLISLWQANHPDGYHVADRDGLLALNMNSVDSVLGLFTPLHMDYFIDVEPGKQPTLAEMTHAAITRLQRESNGFVLLVEGGRIDQAHHNGRAKAALEETLQFDLAIGEALRMTSREDTLIIVTADHAHTMTINGYPQRGNPILGLGDISDVDNKPYTTLTYATGPGYVNAFDEQGQRIDPSIFNLEDKDFTQPALIPKELETHGGDDVGIFATGPQAHLFQGVYEQNYIAHVMGYAACIGSGQKFCDNHSAAINNSGSLTLSLFLGLLTAFFLKIQ